MERVVHAFRANVDDAGRQQDRAAPIFTAVCGDDKAFAIGAIDPRDTRELAACAIALGLLEHSREQLGAGDSLGKTRVVMRAGNQRGATGAAIEEADRKVETGQVDSSGQPRRPGADNYTVFQGSLDSRRWNGAGSCPQPFQRSERRWVPRPQASTGCALHCAASDSDEARPGVGVARTMTVTHRMKVNTLAARPRRLARATGAIPDARSVAGRFA